MSAGDLAKEKKRDATFDIARGIAIILMVIGHTESIAYNFIYLFHIAFFFMLSGYFFKAEQVANLNTLKHNVLKRFKSLYLPFVGYNLFFLLLHNVFININIYTSNPAFLEGNIGNNFGLNEYYSSWGFIKHLLYIIVFSRTEPIGGALWFLKVLFFVYMLFAISFYIIDKIKKYFHFTEKMTEIFRLAFYLTCLMAGYFMYIENFRFYQIGAIFSCVILYYLGTLYKRYEHKIKLNFITLIISITALIIMSIFIEKSFNLSANYYNNPLLLIISSLIGFIFIISVSNILKQNISMTKIFSYIGKNTMPILCLHLLCFKIVTYSQILIFQEPIYRLASFMTLYTDKYWFLVYTVIGIVIPLMINFFIKNLQRERG